MTLRCRINELERENARLTKLVVEHAEIEHHMTLALMSVLKKFKAREASMQARIDALMLEFCPDEMSAWQIANWELHQRSATQEEERDLSTAMKEK